jgi:glycosyltransferase involved in cell wall biosynthesis
MFFSFSNKPKKEHKMTSISADSGRRSSSLIVVAALTYKRPDLLNNLLSKTTQVKIPTDSNIIFLIIDNDPQGSARTIVENYQAEAENIRYVIETERGIPFARNRAIDEAASLEADVLCFIDDDEYPDQDWLIRLVDVWRNTGAKLIGGPVAVAPAENLGIWQRIIHKSLSSRAERKNRSTAKAAAARGRFTVVTNNWFCDVNWLKKTGIRFDETYRFSGGSDSAFFREAKKINCTVAWEPRACVHEIIPADRLSLKYQFNRGRFQSMNHFYIRHPKLTPRILVSALLLSTLKVIAGCILLLVPIRSWSSLVVGLRSIAWSVGCAQAIFGKRSTLYK